MTATMKMDCPVEDCTENLTATVELKVNASSTQGEKPGLYIDIETENVTLTPESKAHIETHIDVIDYRGES